MWLFPEALVASDADVWFSFYSDRFARSRSDLGVGQLLGSGVEGAHPGNATLVHLSTESGEVIGAQTLGSARTYISSMALDARGPILAGSSVGSTVDVAHDVGNGIDTRPFILRPSVWGLRVAAPPGNEGAILGRAEEGFFNPRVTVDATGGFYVHGTLTNAAWVGGAVSSLVSPPSGGSASYIVRAGSNGWRDCQ